MKATNTILIIILVLVSFTSLNAQGEEKVSLTMVVGDFSYLRSEFDEIEIKASEVDALISIQKSMDNVLRMPAVIEKADHETLTIDIIKAMASNILFFMDRMTIQGKDAVKFQRFRTSLQQALSKK